MNSKKLAPASNGMHVRRTALAVAIAMGFGLSGQVMAQATTGTITGQAPVAAGESIQITGGSGYNRTVPVGSSGRYSVTLPVGTYNVTLLQNGQAVSTRENVSPNASGAVTVDFPSAATASNANAENLSAVTVTSNALPAIDVTSTNEVNTITAQQLKQLPLQRTGAAIALLAPGTVQGASLLGNGPTREPLISFGGSSIAENAYYINGFNTSDPLSNQGGITLPYGSISQQQTLLSGYGAEYGRSAGGVISQVGMSGTNEFHAGGQILWRPEFAQGNEGNYYWENPRATSPGQQKGDIYTYRNDNKQWNTVYDGYISGALVKDKLFFFVSAEANKSQDNAVQSITTGNEYYQKYSDPKIYAKVDWNITDSNILSLTGIKTSDSYSGSVYNYDYDKRQATTFSNLDQSYKNAFKIWSANYTSYITDDLSLRFLYGKMDGTYYTNQPAYAGFDPSLPNILGPANQYAGYGGGALTNSNTSTSQANPAHKSEVTNMRLDLDWKLGDHDLKFGIDNDTLVDKNAGDAMTGPGYAWDYGKAADGTTDVASGQNTVAPTGTNPGAAAQAGYYASKYIFVTQATVKVVERAQYIQDSWQVNDRLLLNIGLRNDQFTNYNPDNVAYVRLTQPQWAPRLGASWDIQGDGSMKLFANAGRYYLAMPTGVALRSASAPLYTQEYYTYTGIDPATGIPQGVTPLQSSTGGAVPINGEDGVPIDPRTVASQNLKSEYQDEFVLGFQQQINPSWVYGVTGTVRKLGRIIDDLYASANPAVCNNLIAAGYAAADCDNISGSILINPGSSNTLNIPSNTGGYDSVKVSPTDLGFPPVKRNYYSLELTLGHPWDGKWSANFDYVYSRSYGTSEGPVQSNIGQGGNSSYATEQWDFSQLMEYSNGDLANDRKHAFKAYGTYQIAPEWSVGGIVSIASGTPESCLGFYGPSELNYQDYGSSFHYCGGKPTPGGSTGFTPWTHQLSLSVEYRPLWADKKLAFQLLVNNVTNEQKLTQIYPDYGSTANPDARYLSPEGMETPRYVQVGVTYDW